MKSFRKAIRRPRNTEAWNLFPPTIVSELPEKAYSGEWAHEWGRVSPQGAVFPYSFTSDEQA